MSRLTFVICAYKESPYLRACIRSLLKQTVPCSVLLSTSTPNTWIEQAAAEFSVSLHVHAHEPSIADDWNSAYRTADSDYVVLAHQDDIYEPAYAETAICLLDEASDPLLFFSDYYEIRNGIRTDSTLNLRIKRALLHPLKEQGVAASPKTKRRILALGNAICCPAVTYVKRNLPETPFRSGLNSNLDWDAWERFSRLDGAFLYSPRHLVGHRVHEASATSSLINSHERTGEDLEMLKRFWPAPVASAINRAYRAAETSNSLKAKT